MYVYCMIWKLSFWKLSLMVCVLLCAFMCFCVRFCVLLCAFVCFCVLLCAFVCFCVTLCVHGRAAPAHSVTDGLHMQTNTHTDGLIRMVWMSVECID